MWTPALAVIVIVIVEVEMVERVKLSVKKLPRGIWGDDGLIWLLVITTSQ